MATVLKLFLTAVLTLTFLCSHAQSWASRHATWHYSHKNQFDAAEGFIKYVVEKDTSINGQSCRKINKLNDLYCYQRGRAEFTFERNDSIFFWDTTLKQFQMLYDFGAKSGDVWKIRWFVPGLGNDTIRCEVDSVTTIQINTVTRKKWHVTYRCGSRSDHSEIIQNIGDLTYMFHYFDYGPVACDGDFTGGLRCFEDSAIGLYSTGISPACEYVTTTVQESEPSGAMVTLYPVPTGGRLLVGYDEARPAPYKITDLAGKVLQSGIVDGNVKHIDVDALTRGIYFCVITVGGRSQVMRFVVQ